MSLFSVKLHFQLIKEKGKALSLLFSCCCICAPVFSPYGINGINMGILLYIIPICIAFVWGKFLAFNVSREYLRYFLYILSVPVVFVFIRWGYFNFSKSEILFFLALIYLLSNYNATIGQNLYEKVVFILCIIFLLQEITFYVTGYRFSGLIPFLPLFYEQERGIQMEDFMMLQSMKERSSSVFLEPSHFAQYLIPFLALHLFRKRNNAYLMAIFVTLILFALKSGVGLILSSIIWVVWLLKSKKHKFFLTILFLMSPLLILVINAFLNTEYASDLLERLNEVSFDAGSNVSGFIRIFRGYILWNDMDFVSKICGVSSNFILGKIVTYYDSYWLFSEELYLNTFQTKLVYAGILGVCLYVHWLYCVFQKSDECGKVLILVLFILMLMESVNLSLILMYVLLALGENPGNSLNRNKFYAKWSCLFFERNK